MENQKEDRELFRKSLETFTETSKTYAQNVKDHIAWEGTNLFVIGGPAKQELDKMNTKEKYTPIIGSDRYDTIRSCLRFVGK